MRILAALLFSAHALTAPFWVLCRAPGPEGHESLELAFASCCSDHEEHDAGVPDAPGCCGACEDEKVHQPVVVQPPQVPVFCAAVLPVFNPSFTKIPILAVDPRPEIRPPLFLTHCSFRI